MSTEPAPLGTRQSMMTNDVLDDRGTDSAAEFADFVRAEGERLLWTAFLLCQQDRHTAEDIVQDALGDLYRRWSSVQPAARLSYARRIVVRKASRRWRAPRRHYEVLIDSHEGTGWEPSASDRLPDHDLRGALRLLSPRQRAVIVLRYYDDLSEADIAAALGCSTGSVKTHASRGLARLRAALSEGDDAR